MTNVFVCDNSIAKMYFAINSIYIYVCNKYFMKYSKTNIIHMLITNKQDDALDRSSNEIKKY